MNETDQFPAIHPVQFHTVYPHTTTHILQQHAYTLCTITCTNHTETQKHIHTNTYNTHTHTYIHTHIHMLTSHTYTRKHHTHIHHPFDRLTIIVAHIQQAATGNTLHPVTQRFTTRDRTLLHYSGKQRTPATVEQLLSTQICKLKYIVTFRMIRSLLTICICSL